MAGSFTYKKVKYNVLDEATVCVAKNEKYAGSLEIPETIEKNGSSFRVTAIESGAFFNSGITSVDIPGSIKILSGSAFAGTPLEAVTLHEGTEVIESRVFKNCKLTTVLIPESTKTIQQESFSGCEFLEDVAFVNPSGIAEVYFSSFEGTKWQSRLLDGSDSLILGDILVGVNTKDNAFRMPDGIKSLSPDAFSKCASLKEVIIPDGMTELTHGVFNQCGALERIKLPSTFGR